MGLGPDRVDLSGGEIPVLERNTPTVLNIAFNGVERRRRRGGRRGDEFAPLPASVDAETEARAPMFWDRRVRGLEALTNPDFDCTVPESVPSGLPPGGRIGEQPTGTP